MQSICWPGLIPGCEQHCFSAYYNLGRLGQEGLRLAIWWPSIVDLISLPWLLILAVRPPARSTR
jgi:hypothetical protein